MSDTLPPFLTALQSSVGPDILTTEPDVLARHTEDWSGISGGAPIAVARPRSAQEVSALLALCHARGQKVAVQGGLTGLCGSASTNPGELALSLSRLDTVSIENGAMIAGAGVTIANAQAAARAADLELGIDFGARGTAVVGGAIGTNAGGLHVIGEGMTRAQVLGLEVVLADGRILSELTPMVKVNAGFDLKHLFIGSEGTLGVVTRACLALRPYRAGLATAVAALASADAVVDMLTAAKRALGPDLSAFEAMWPEFVETMLARTDFTMPIKGPMLTIIEARDTTSEGASARMEAFLASASEAGIVTDAIIAQSEAQAKALWAMRDEGPAIYGQIFADAIGFDVSIPLSSMVAAAEQIVAPLRDRPGLFPMAYGHIGDQNLHVVVASEHKLTAAEDKAIKDGLYKVVTDLSGTISAEHGIGYLKKDYLALSRGPVALSLMRDLKRTLDPKAILNPGRVFDL